jgi:hypothetical protein
VEAGGTSLMLGRHILRMSNSSSKRLANDRYGETGINCMRSECKRCAWSKAIPLLCGGRGGYFGSDLSLPCAAATQGLTHSTTPNQRSLSARVMLQL